MNAPTRTLSKKKSILILVMVWIGLISILAFLVATYFSPSKILSLYWHWNNPNPITWRNLQIHVPETLVAKKFISSEDKKLLISNFDSDIIIHLHYLQTTEDLTNNSVSSVFINNLIAHFHEKGSKKVQKIDCKIKNDLCIRIKSETYKEGAKFVREDIIYLKSKVWLSVDDYSENRKEFQLIVDNLKILDDYGD